MGPKGGSTAAPAAQTAGLDEATLASGWQMQEAGKVAETTGEAISQPGYAPGNWYPATVPGTVLTTLVNNKVYPEPLWGENNRPNLIPETLCRTAYWYRVQFTVPASHAGRRTWLNFHGINYMAEVFVNGHKAGDIKGAFVRGIFDVTPFVKPGETAALAVRILPPLHPGEPQEQTVQLGLGPNGGELTQDGPTFVCSVGWDWIPAIRDRNMGLWQKVTLASSGPVVLRNPLVTSDLPLPRSDSADLTLETTVKNLTGAPQSGLLRGSFGDASFQVPVSLAPNESKLVKLTPQDTPQLRILNPRLWWPNGYGDPNLYAMHLSFEVGGAISDRNDFNFGIRKIQYEVPDSQFLTLSVNGVRVFCKGGCWGMDEALKRIPRQRLEAQIRFQKEAHYVMLRNWVGQSTSDDFYDLCDRSGLMVWDEFFEANRSDGPAATDVDLYLANVREKVLRYRNHPCIALWCGRNESDPAPPPLAAGISNLMKELEPSRIYHANSDEGHGVHSGGPYSWRPPAAFYTYPTSGRGVEVFKTEIGCVSIPTRESILAWMPEKDTESFPNDDWAEHDLARGNNNGDTYVNTIGARYGTLSGSNFSLVKFVHEAQMADYEAYRALYEGRDAKLFTGSTAALTWMSNPAQPSTCWQIYSYDLEPFASFFGARKACEQVHVMMNQATFDLMVINQTPKPLHGLQARVRVINMDGSVLSDKTTPVSAQPSCAANLGPIAFPSGLSPVHFVKTELHDAQGQLLSDNFYWRGLSPNDLTALNSLPPANLEASIRRLDAAGKCLLDVTLSNPSKVVALMTHIQLRKQSSNERVLPVYYDDNYVSLLPGERRTIRVEAASKDLGGDNPLIVVDGWNPVVQGRSFSGGVSIAPNTPALVIGAPAAKL
ncbi:MAG: sugar-binding domain-containing protein [Verrucomicrobiota bacterium]|jgi:beta-mannosidase